MIPFFVSLYVFIISQWLMHSRFSFHYFHWMTIDSVSGLLNSIVVFIAIELLYIWLIQSIKNQKIKSLIKIAMNFLFGALLLNAVSSISYQKYRYAPYFSALWVLACINCELKESLISNLALLGIYFYSK